jgi:hypothetical protein
VLQSLQDPKSKWFGHFLHLVRFQYPEEPSTHELTIPAGCP